MMTVGAAAAMDHFYLQDDDEDGIWRCTLSQLDGTAITITGLTAEGEIRSYSGIVQSLVRDVRRDPDRRWRVTLYYGESRTSTQA